jgi:2,3-dihydroxybenzoate-AMP ligase
MSDQSGRCAPVTGYPPELEARYRAEGHWRADHLFGLLRQAAQLDPQRVALVCGERRYSYTALCTRASSLAVGFLELGLKAGDRAIVQLGNVAEFLEVLFALFRLGVVPLLTHPAHRRRELLNFAEQAQPAMYVAHRQLAGFDYSGLAETLQSEAATLRVVMLGDSSRYTSLSELYRPGQPACAEPAAESLALLQLSGGSTGCPKLIPRTHADYACAVRAGAEACGLSAQDAYLVALPANHNFPMSSPGALGALFTGAKVVMAARPEPRVTFPLIERERVTITALVPTLLTLWSEARRHRPDDLSSLRLLQVGGAKLPAKQALAVEPTFGCRLQQVFGMAEGLVCYTRAEDSAEVVAETQGRPGCEADEIRIVDDEDRDVPLGEPGHLLARGPYTIRGYYAATAHNQNAFTKDGFYRTGDIVRQLTSGHLIVHGRFKDQINRGGEKIAVAEVEEALEEHPQVRQAAVVAVPDRGLGERSFAFVIAKGELDAAELRAFLRDIGLAAYKQPDRYQLVASLPTTSIGKVDKAALRQRALEAS